MSQTQALVQSMLQRLRLQADTETQGGFLPASPTTATCQPHQQTAGLNGDPAQNGLGTATDCDVVREGLPRGQGLEVRRFESCEIPLDSNLDNSVKVNGEQVLFNGSVTDSGQEMAQPNSPKTFSSTSCKSNIDSDAESGGTVQTVTSSVVSGCLFPVSPENDANSTSFARTNDKMEAENKGNGNHLIEGSVIHDDMSGAVRDNNHNSLTGDSTSASQSHSPSSDPGMTAESGTLTQTLCINGDSSTPPVQGFSTRVYAWSPKGPSTVSGETSTAHQGNEDPGLLVQSQDPEIGSNIPDSTSPPLQRNRASGSRTKRWTQKIKEKFKERGGSLKKKKEAEKDDAKSEDEGQAPTENECRTTEDASSVTSETVGATDQTPVTAFTNPEPSPVETRSSNDFDLGLGSFSLLEEIKTGQYWANFLSPALPDILTSQTTAHQHAGQSNISALTGLRGDTQSSGSINQWGNPGVAVATSPADLPVPVTMDISEPDRSLVPMVTDHDPSAEPMEQHSQSDIVSETRGPPPPAADQVQHAGIVHNTILRSQIQRNRKRAHHRVLERTSGVGVSEIDGKGASPDEPSSSSSGLGNGTAGGAEDNSRLFLYPLKIHPKPSSPAPCEFVPKGILKQTHSSDSEGGVPMETSAKKRRMEVRRQVCFAEAVVCIPPVVPDISTAMDSEEESGSEKNSEEEKEEENATAQGSGAETIEPARPPTLPGWIRALRRRTGRKPKL